MRKGLGIGNMEIRAERGMRIGNGRRIRNRRKKKQKRSDQDIRRQANVLTGRQSKSRK